MQRFAPFHTPLTVLLVAMTLAGTALAGVYEDAVAAYDRKDYASAVRLLRPLANEGNAAAQRKLGVMYANGEGVPHDYTEARKWYLMAVGQNDAAAQNELGLMYYLGMGVPEDDAEAQKWFRKAADQGFAGAQNNLGNMYARGNGVPQDYIEAHKWFNLAVARMPTSETKGRDTAVANRDSVAAKMTPTQIGEAQKLAREWKPK